MQLCYKENIVKLIAKFYQRDAVKGIVSTQRELSLLHGIYVYQYLDLLLKYYLKQLYNTMICHHIILFAVVSDSVYRHRFLQKARADQLCSSYDGFNNALFFNKSSLHCSITLSLSYTILRRDTEMSWFGFFHIFL